MFKVQQIMTTKSNFFSMFHYSVPVRLTRPSNLFGMFVIVLCNGSEISIISWPMHSTIKLNVIQCNVASGNKRIHKLSLTTCYQKEEVIIIICYIYSNLAHNLTMFIISYPETIFWNGMVFQRVGDNSTFL